MIMSEEKKDDTITGNTKIVSIISLILFIICMILLINFILPLCNISINIRDVSLRLISILLFFVFVPFLPIYILYLLFSTIFIYNKYKKIIYINIVSAAILSIFFTLYFTGFCFKEMRYWSKAEIIDVAISAHIWRSCEQEYRIKYGDLPKLENPKRGSSHIDYDKIYSECSIISFEKVKEEAPQCFTHKRKNSCKGTVTHFDKKTNATVKSEVEIYSYYPFYADNIMNHIYKRFYVGSDLDLFRDGNRFVVSACGGVDCYGCWD
jgi:hypothetical protein